MSPDPVPWRLRLPPRHPAGLTEAAAVACTTQQRALARMRTAAATNDLALLFGPSGTGKTFAALTFIDEVRATDRLAVYLTTMAAAQYKTVTEQLLEALTQARVKGETYTLANDLLDLLDTLNPVVVLDEAHRARHLGVDQLLYLKERAGPCWTLILVGNGLREACGRDPSLASRAHNRSVAFEPLDRAELLPALRAFHPLLRDTEPELLQRIDARYCRGEWRRWAELTAETVRLHAERVAAGKPPVRALSAKVFRVVAGRLGWDAWDGAA